MRLQIAAAATPKLAAAAAFAAIPLIAMTGTASAVTTHQYDNVKYVFCADTPGATNEVSYYDSYGRREQINVSLPEAVGGSRHCGSLSYTEYEKYGSYVGSSISNTAAPYVYCSIWVNGVKVAESEDYSNYGYSSAFC
ncbi:hypothetical protein ACFYVR_21780 [Rhodococcus sp. NPDC003318]|uniref:hypothetical protein n=1 Tax=Rhodococcus sp. NPDC003318 TaxID=3364503 RepID=UPI0036771A75